ncbi:VOC family protein [Roseateles sp. SL47]|uniref:VOC family protein n=1 Tax=Roseateles sp. SL47 TaxID=2995138 RepID=UPI00226DBF1A|nr:VOC family protein [Roseateles sp. SL47]WAC72685.1 VOC family protein [Roseateles sp. SL47]
MDVFKTHGAFSWSELMTTDPAKAAEFYGGLFGWKLDTMPLPGGGDGEVYRVAKVGDTAVGGLMTTPKEAPMPPHWACYVTVDDVEATVARAQELGGTVLMPVTEIPTVGRMATLQDPQGAVVNVITYSMPVS